MADQALIPVDERTVDFYGDNVTAVRIVDGPSPGVYVPLKPISDNIGLDWSAQYRRIQRDPILSQVSQLIAVTAIKSQRGNPEAIALPLKFLPGWLFGINASRVRDELKEKVLRYQLECYDVLWEAFQDGRLTADPAFEELLASNSPAVQTYKMLRDPECPACSIDPSQLVIAEYDELCAPHPIAPPPA